MADQDSLEGLTGDKLKYRKQRLDDEKKAAAGDKSAASELSKIKGKLGQAKINRPDRRKPAGDSKADGSSSAPKKGGGGVMDAIEGASKSFNKAVGPGSTPWKVSEKVMDAIGPNSVVGEIATGLGTAGRGGKAMGEIAPKPPKEQMSLFDKQSAPGKPSKIKTTKDAPAKKGKMDDPEGPKDRRQKGGSKVAGKRKTDPKYKYEKPAVKSSAKTDKIKSKVDAPPKPGKMGDKQGPKDRRSAPKDKPGGQRKSDTPLTDKADQYESMSHAEKKKMAADRAKPPAGAKYNYEKPEVKLSTSTKPKMKYEKPEVKHSESDKARPAAKTEQDSKNAEGYQRHKAKEATKQIKAEGSAKPAGKARNPAAEKMKADLAAKGKLKHKAPEPKGPRKLKAGSKDPTGASKGDYPAGNKSYKGVVRKGHKLPHEKSKDEYSALQPSATATQKFLKGAHKKGTYEGKISPAQKGKVVQKKPGKKPHRGKGQEIP